MRHFNASATVPGWLPFYQSFYKDCTVSQTFYIFMKDIPIPAKTVFMLKLGTCNRHVFPFIETSHSGVCKCATPASAKVCDDSEKIIIIVFVIFWCDYVVQLN